jgi:hypothetical protein
MNVDEAVQCTFWYTSEYAVSDFEWGTWIGAFSFPECTDSPDTDADTVLDCIDDCPEVANPSQSDADGDEIGDACDSCPDGLTIGVFQDDSCGDGDGGFVRLDEIIMLDVILRSDTMSPALPDLTGTLTAEPLIDVLVGTQTFQWTPTPSGQRAQATFVVAIEPAHPCPDSFVDLLVSLTGEVGCEATLPFTLELEICTPDPSRELRGEVPSRSVRVRKEPPEAVRVDWQPVPGASLHNLYRGLVDDLFVNGTYSHVASVPLGAGQCGVMEPTVTYLDPDDAAVGFDDFYYLVTGVCGIEGPTGFDSFGVERPRGTGCP